MTTSTSALSRSKLSARVSAASGTSVIAAVTVVILVLATFFVDTFASPANLRGLLLSISLIGIVAVGVSLITIVGRVFTLSVPALVALSTITFAASLHFGEWIALLLTLALGIAVGFIQGIVIGKRGTDPIITTIAAAAIMLGIGQVLTGGRTVVGTGDTTFFNSNILGFVPFQACVFIVLTAALTWWHKYSAVGRRLSLVGLNEKAAEVSGLRGWPLVTLAFVVSGATTAVAGALLSAQSGQGTLLLGSSFGFDAIVAVVVGGVAVTGGIGSPIGAAIGALFVGLLENVLALIGLGYETQLVIKGVLVLLAVTAMGFTGMRGGNRK